ncbi:hypothetical protein SAMN05421786_102546 [Chryseobacterium ureilyticum]|uniref:Uncharacterized protein n=1 Tax=Chryseobacterium ureilyticum TaxID=373668 RepID=A0A1N7MFQ1_9FLAO|nr:hypothetical protein [Chryseobacterium ureilyticum]SIS84850.1 hypothetical protein SAMN05421786_102546 [Chryseobacterium ureilyticum]
MIFIDTPEKVNNFIISKINFQDNEIELNKKYYILIEDEPFEVDSEDYDCSDINYKQFLSQPDINFIIQKYETLLVSEIEYYQQDFITTVANNFRAYNTELSQKKYYENTILSLKNCISRFTEKLDGKDDFNIPLNKIQRITITNINDAHTGIIRMLNDEYDKYINPTIKVDNLRTIFGLDLHFITKLHTELKAYELLSTSISNDSFFEILNINYRGEDKIILKLNNLNEFYYLVRYLKEKFSSKHMDFYQQISDRFLVDTNEKTKIHLKPKKISGGISDLNNQVTSREVSKSSEIKNVVINLG